MNPVTNFYAGASGLVLPVPNKTFYPQEFQSGSRLKYYAHLFNSVEINSSFYKLPMVRTVARWVAEVPDDFRFTFKLWRDISHVKSLKFTERDVHRFMEAIEPARSKAGCLLIQFPAGLHHRVLPEVERLLYLMDEADPKAEWTRFLEFRNPGWYSDAVQQVLNRHNSFIVQHDKAGTSFRITEDLPQQIYLRFHGPSGNYRGSYSDDFLYEYAAYISSWLSDGCTVYTYFNNTMGDAVRNLQTLRNYVESYFQALGIPAHLIPPPSNRP